MGGENAPAEIAKFGKHIALNPTPALARANPFPDQGAGENIAKVFKPGSVDAIVSRELDVLTLDGGATFSLGVMRSLKGRSRRWPGGRLDMAFHLGIGTDAKFAEKFTKALVDAGFNPKNVKNVGNRVFSTSVR